MNVILTNKKVIGYWINSKGKVKFSQEFDSMTEYQNWKNNNGNIKMLTDRKPGLCERLP